MYYEETRREKHFHSLNLTIKMHNYCYVAYHYHYSTPYHTPSKHEWKNTAAKSGLDT